MISKKELQSVYYLTKEIEKREKEKREIGYGVKAWSAKQVNITGTKGNSADELNIKRLEIEEKLRKLEEEINRACEKIIDAIYQITDIRLKRIVILRCIYLLSWQEIANRTGSTADSERMYYKRAFDEQGYIKLVYFD